MKHTAYERALCRGGLIFVPCLLLSTTFGPGCGSDPDGTINGDTIKITALLTLSGGGKIGRDKQAQDVMAMAVKEVNDAGGVLGKTLVLEILNTEDSESLAETLSAKAVDDGAVALIATAIGPAFGAMKTAIAKKVPLIETGSCHGSMGLHPDDGYMFRSVIHPKCGGALTEAAREVDADYNKVAYKSIMFFTNCDTDVQACGGPGMTQATITIDPDNPRTIEGFGVPADEVIHVENISRAVPVPTSYATEVQNAIDAMQALGIAKPDAIGISVLPSHGEILLKNLLDAGLLGSGNWRPLLGCGCTMGGHIGNVFKDIFGDSAELSDLGGLIHCGRDVWDRNVEPYMGYAARVEAEFPGHKPQKPGIANSYDAVILLALAMEQAGSTTGVDIRDALAGDGVSKTGTKVTTYAEGLAALKKGDDIDYDGVSGPIDFNSEGNASIGAPMLKIFNSVTKKRDKFLGADAAAKKGAYPTPGIE